MGRGRADIYTLRHSGIIDANLLSKPLSLADMESGAKPPDLDNSGAVKLIFTGFSIGNTPEKSEFAWSFDLFLLT